MAYRFIPRTYSILDNKTYGKLRSFYKRQAFEVQEKFENYLYNALGRAIQHSDPSHLADAIHAARELNQYRSVSRVLHSLPMPWKWDDIENPKGDVPAANKNKLAYMRIHWQTEFAQAMDKEEINSQRKIELSSDMWWKKKQATILYLVKQAKEHGIDMADFAESVNKAIEKVAPEVFEEEKELETLAALEQYEQKVA